VNLGNNWNKGTHDRGSTYVKQGNTNVEQAKKSVQDTQTSKSWNEELAQSQIC
jgi:hypothetical protein